MDMVVAGDDRHGAAGLQQRGLLHSQMADAEMRGDRFRVFEVETRMDARSLQDVKRTGECVLMNIGAALEPKQDLDVKTQVVVDYQFRLPKTGLRLKRLLVLEQEFFDQPRQ